jgi:Gaa1-like, GPI transamidase component
MISTLIVVIPESLEGLNGRLPNQDLINSFHVISRHTGGVPVVVYDHLDNHDHPDKSGNLIFSPSWLPAFLRDNWHVQDYAYRAKNLIHHFGFQSRGRASGVHGLLHPSVLPFFHAVALLHLSCQISYRCHYHFCRTR